MTALAYLRHPVSLLAAVSAVIGFVWYVLGLPVQMPPSPLQAGEKLPCVSYAPPVSAEGGPVIEVAPARIAADLAALAPHTSCVRTYLTGAGLDRVAEIARKHGLMVLQGIRIGPNVAENRVEIERIVALSRLQRPAVRAIIVGSEVLSRGDLSAFELAALIRDVQERTKLPVSYADLPDIWLNGDLIAASVDFITLQVPLYDAEFPVAAADAARHVLAAHAKVKARYSTKEIAIGEAGWPSAGRMRETALPSPANQGRVFHDLIAATKAGNISLNIFEAIDQGSRDRMERSAGAHWGLLRNETYEAKFRWGGTVINHPLWFMQAATGIMLALVVFAAGFLSARSVGPESVAAARWEPVALIALGAGAFVGWAVADLPVQSGSITDWASGTIVLALAFIMPPVAAAAVVRRTPFEGFSVVLDPLARRAAHSLVLSVTFLFLLSVLFGIQSALALAFDPDGRNFPSAALTGPAIALLVLSIANSAGTRRDSYAEAGAALVLAGTALLIALNESFLNWQALWFAALLVALAFACWRTPGAQRRQ